MMTRLGIEVFCSALQGSAMAITDRSEARELVEHAKWIADEAEQMAAREGASSASTDLDGEPFPLVRRSGSPAPHVFDSSVFRREVEQDEAANG